MSQPLPTGDFKWRFPTNQTDIKLKDIETDNLNEAQKERVDDIVKFWEKKILEWPDDAPLGCIPKVDLKYPHELHDLHNDYSLCPE
jgi:hypothetical protein